jgi:capsular polysaccharide biosynthesis protein
MDFSGFLRMMLRQKLIIAVVVIAAMIASATVAFLQPVSYQTTLLYSTGIANETQLTEGFDATKLADDFANTISGWLRSPDFTRRLSELANTAVSISGETQAKQNFLVNLNYGDNEATSRISALAQRMLQEEIAKYNQPSKLKFVATLHGETNAAKQANLFLTLMAAALGGLLLAIGWILIANLLGGRVTSLEEAEKLLGINAAVKISYVNSEEINFLEALVKKIGSNATLLGADIKLDKLIKKLKNNPKNGSLPNEASLLVKSEARPIIVVKLDTTKISTLGQIKAIAEKDLHLVVWG